MAHKAKETESFAFSNWTVEVHRRAFRRSVSIYLYPQKPIKVVAGSLTTHKVIYEFLLSKKDWIEKHLQKFSELSEKFPERKIKSYSKFPFLGRELSLKMAVTVLQKPFVAIQEEELRLHIPHNRWTEEILTDEHPELLAVIREFYKREGVKLLTERSHYWSERMGLWPRTLKFREQKTRWGSCSSRLAINFNWRLVVFKPEIIDYVIIHELAHLRHMNHSVLFWDLVEKHCSEYQFLMKELRDSQFLSEFLTPQA